MSYIRFETDTLIFVDPHRLAGGILTPRSNGVATIVTGPVAKALEASLFSQQAAPDALVQLIRNPPVKAALVNTAGAAVSDTVLPGISVTDAPTTFSVTDQSEHSEEGTVTLGGMQCWRPAGQMRRVSAEGITVHFVAANQDLSGKLRATTSFSAMRCEEIPEIHALDSSCGSCSVCGACGACGLCGEANVASAAVAVGAVTAVANLGIRSLRAAAVTRTPNNEQQKVLAALQSLLQ